MRTTARFTRGVLVGLVAAGVALTTAACSSPSDPGTSDPAEGTDVITVAADPSLLPGNFLDENNEWVGLNVDLAAALSEELGRELEFESAGFDTIIPGLESGRYDMALTGMFDTQERQKTVDFIDYFLAKSNFLATADSPDYQEFADLCGVVVGLPAGALEISRVEEATADCVAAGDEPITLNTYDDLNAVILALTSGRIQVTPNDSSTNAYVLEQIGDEYKVSGSYDADGYFAATFPKDSPLLDEVKTAFATIMSNGVYDDILAEWGVTDRGMDEPLVNASPF